MSETIHLDLYVNYMSIFGQKRLERKGSGEGGQRKLLPSRVFWKHIIDVHNFIYIATRKYTGEAGGGLDWGV